MLTRYGGSGVGPRNTPFKTPIVQEEPSFSTNQEKSPVPSAFDSSYDPGPTTTGTLPSVHPHPGIALPARDGEAILEMMAAGKAPAEKPKGLLSRYRENTL